jgi:hypothetical protein
MQRLQFFQVTAEAHQPFSREFALNQLRLPESQRALLEAKSLDVIHRMEKDMIPESKRLGLGWSLIRS